MAPVSFGGGRAPEPESGGMTGDGVVLEKASDGQVDGETDDVRYMTVLKTFRAIARKVKNASATVRGIVLLARAEDVAATETDTGRVLTVATGKTLIDRVAPSGTSLSKASNTDVDTETDDAKYMTVAKVFRAIARKVKNASGTVRGIVLLARAEDVAATETDTGRVLTVATGKTLIDRVAPSGTSLSKASNTDVDTETDDAKYMTVAKVFRAIARKVKNASVTVRGIVLLARDEDVATTETDTSRVLTVAAAKTLIGRLTSGGSGLDKASNTDVDTETDDTKYMTVAKVFRAIARKVVNASTAVRGIVLLARAEDVGAKETDTSRVLTVAMAKALVSRIAGTVVLAGTREPTPQDGADGDFWIYGGNNGQLLSISENVEGVWVEIARATDDTAALALLQHLTRDLHTVQLVSPWESMDDSEVDLFWTVPVNGEINLMDDYFDGEGASIKIPASTSARTTYVFGRFPAAADISRSRVFLVDSGDVVPANNWGRAEDEGVTIPDGDRYQYWLMVLNLNETAALSFQMQKREVLANSRFDGALGGEALAQLLQKTDPLEHLTRDLHVEASAPDWEDAADTDGDLIAVLASTGSSGLTDADFNGAGASVTIPAGQNAATDVYARLPIGADLTLFQGGLRAEFHKIQARQSVAKRRDFGGKRDLPLLACGWFCQWCRGHYQAPEARGSG